MSELLQPTAVPCGSCPYRKDVASGIWHESEYQKLPLYDGETWQQSPALFHCHQRNGHLCAGWLGCHDQQHLLALRIHGNSVSQLAWEYHSPVELFSSGAEAAAHGMKDIPNPGQQASRMIDKILTKRTRSAAPPLYRGKSS